MESEAFRKEACYHREAACSDFTSNTEYELQPFIGTKGSGEGLTGGPGLLRTEKGAASGGVPAEGRGRLFRRGFGKSENAWNRALESRKLWLRVRQEGFPLSVPRRGRLEMNVF
ncbi:hypothetical protein [Candidatus Methylacidithermus pantelleriae]|uniref:Uncharacterized protein n=1 Tax=Candidatus Methylacidithermus pantelleriae TaxID=2744239 RepID=A0A8J2BNJ9_9BACT|nr:hypothetical protein [Candidatus Methylacidithermus pantelleriae]CAF0696241.1 hypothetical protein MPNT_20162 [Candidatus Methylacidithermus pantelleriae]